MNKWDKRFMNMAKLVATWSKDRSVGVGAIIVDNNKKVKSIGYNGFPKGVDDDVESRHNRPEKDYYVIHAERNCLDQAEGSVEGDTMYCTFFSCANCAHGIIQNGIKKIVAPEPDWDKERYSVSQKAALTMYKEAGVEVEYYKDDSKDSLIAIWEIGCGGGKVHDVITIDNFKKYVDSTLKKMNKENYEITDFEVDFELKTIIFKHEEEIVKTLCFDYYELDAFMFTR